MFFYIHNNEKYVKNASNKIICAVNTLKPLPKEEIRLYLHKPLVKHDILSELYSIQITNLVYNLVNEIL